MDCVLMPACLGDGGGYYSPGARPESAASSSPPTSAPLIVPQPINVAKMSGAGALHPHQHPHQAIRKYQCKMCPQVRVQVYFSSV